jgi:hypothetical protein
MVVFRQSFDHPCFLLSLLALPLRLPGLLRVVPIEQAID